MMRILQSMKIKTSLMILLSMSMVAMVLLGAFGISGANTVDALEDDSYNRSIVPNKYLREITNAFATIRIIVRDYPIGVLTGDDAYIKDDIQTVLAADKTIEETLAQYEGYVTEHNIQGAERELILGLRGKYQPVKTVAMSINSLALAGEMEPLLNAILNDFDPVNNAMKTAVADLTSLNLERAASNHEQTEQGTNAALISLIACFVISSLLLAPLALTVIHSITKPVSHLVEVAQKLAQGDVDMQVDTSFNGELGDLSRSFAKMVDSVHHQAEQVERLADGDFAVDIDVRSEADRMGKSLHSLVDKLNEVFAAFQSASTNVSSGAGHVADSAQTLAQGSTEQASAVEQLSASMSAVSEKTRENTQMAEKAASLAESIKSSAEQGSVQMDRMTQAVKDINDASQSINRVIKVIDDIAFQTNILALNAAVEAARAGQHGRGFAVVAEEVRNLASKSSEAAKDTGALIVNSIEKAELGARIADETAASLAGIVSGINESNRIVVEIAHSSEAQNASISEINHGIEQVAKIVQQNSATAQESAATSEELSSQSRVLQQLLGEFELKSGEASLPAGRRARPHSLAAGAHTAGSDFGKY